MTITRSACIAAAVAACAAAAVSQTVFAGCIEHDGAAAACVGAQRAILVEAAAACVFALLALALKGNMARAALLALLASSALLVVTPKMMSICPDPTMSCAAHLAPCARFSGCILTALASIAVSASMPKKRSSA